MSESLGIHSKSSFHYPDSDGQTEDICPTIGLGIVKQEISVFTIVMVDGLFKNPRTAEALCAMLP